MLATRVHHRKETEPGTGLHPENLDTIPFPYQKIFPFLLYAPVVLNFTGYGFSCPKYLAEEGDRLPKPGASRRPVSAFFLAPHAGALPQKIKPQEECY